MKYPLTLTKKIEEVTSIVNSWSISIPASEVIKWMMQFDNNDFELAYRIVKNLNVIGYDELKSGLNIAYSKLERKSIDKGTKINSKNTLFAGIGEGGKSGAMISYNFRISNELSEENFLDDDSLAHIEKGRIENIVLVDDIISTGRQAIDEIQKLTESLVPLGVKNIFLLTAVGMKDGIKKVEEETGAYVFSAFEYDINDTVISYDSTFYEGLDFQGMQILRERLEYYGKICNPKSPLGYGNTGALIVFYYNTPNSTIPHVWSTLNSWLPLFKRTLRINGIDSYYKQFDTLQSQKPKQKKGKEEINIFVEGKTAERFFESVQQKLKEALGFEKINVIALGIAYSEKLIENLHKAESKYLFVLEEDRFAPSAYNLRIEKMFKDKPYVKMKPLLEYFDLDSILKDDEFQKNLKPIVEVDKELTNRQLRREFEMHLWGRYPSSVRDEIMKKLVVKHLDQKELDALLTQMKEKTK